MLLLFSGQSGYLALNKKTDFQGVYLATLSADSSSIVVSQRTAPFGGIGGLNLKPPTSGSPTVTLNSHSITAEGAASAYYAFSATLSGMTFDDTIASIDVSYAIAGTGNYHPWTPAVFAPSTGSVSGVVHGLAAQQGYDIALQPRGQNGQALGAPLVLGTSPTVSASAITAVLTNSNLPAMPSGATITASSITATVFDGGMHTGFSSAYIPELNIAFTLGDSNSPNSTQWGNNFVVGVRQHSASSPTDPTTYTLRSQPSVAPSALGNGSAQTVVTGPLTPGASYDVVIALCDKQGNPTPYVQILSNYAVPQVSSGAPVGPIWGRPHLLPIGTDPTNGVWNTSTNSLDQSAHDPAVLLGSVTGLGKNLVADSDFAFGFNGYWTNVGLGGISRSPGVGGLDAGLYFTGTGAASSFNYAYGKTRYLTGGPTYTFSAYAFASQVTSGAIQWYVMDAALTTVYATLSFTASSYGRKSVPFTVPSSATYVVVADTNNATIASGQSVIWSEPMIEPGSVMTGYASGVPDATGYWPRGIHHPDVTNTINVGGGIDFSSALHTNKTTQYITEAGGLYFAGEHGADITGNHTANDTSKVNGVAASTVQDGANRASNVIDPSFNILNVEFPGGKLQPNGSITNVNGATASQWFATGNGNVISAEGAFKAGSAGGTNTCEIFIGHDANNGYFLSYTPSSGVYRIGNVVSGVGTSLGSGTIGADLNIHTLKLTVNVNSANFIEGSVDTFHLTASDSALNLGAGQAIYATVYTCGSDGTLSHWKYLMGNTHYALTSPEYQGNFDSSGNSKKSTMFNSKLPNMLTWTSNLVLETSSSGVSPNITMNFWYDNGTAGQDATIYNPDGSTINVGHSTSSVNNVTLSGVTSGQSIYALMYYTLGSGMTLQVSKTPFTLAQVTAAYADGGYVAINATTAPLSGVSGGSSGPISGGGGGSRGRFS